MWGKVNVFDQISPCSNESFSSLSSSDLDDLLFLIDNYRLVLRDTLNIPISETFGLEIECEMAEWEKIFRRVKRDWFLCYDISLCAGAELKSPILRDTKDSWKALKKMCHVVEKYSEIGINAGGHVHIGIQAIEDKKESLINFMKLWALYENIIFRFSYGEFLSPRPIFLKFSKPVCNEFVNLCAYNEIGSLSKTDLILHLAADKNMAVNFRHYDTLKTIEFRCPNATFNPAIWQNNVNLFMKMLLYSNSTRFDGKIIKEKLDNRLLCPTTSSKIYLDTALEFVDLVFDNNLDKICFLKQYLKSFEVSEEYERAKSFS